MDLPIKNGDFPWLCQFTEGKYVNHGQIIGKHEGIWGYQWKINRNKPGYTDHGVKGKLQEASGNYQGFYHQNQKLGVPANVAFSHFPVIPHVSLRLGQQCGANFDFPSEAAPWPTAATAKRLTAKHTFEALAVVDVVTSQDLCQVCQVCVTCKFAYLVVQLLA